MAEWEGMDIVSAGPVKKKRKYEKLSLDQKVQIIRAAEMGYSQRTLASQYNCGKTQIHLLVTQKDMWIAKWERSRRNDNFSRVHNTASSVSTINNLVWDFYKKACLNDVIITGPMLQERAQQISDTLHVANFASNPSWLEKFLEEFNVHVPVIPSVNNFDKPADPMKVKPSPLVKGYEKSNIYYYGMIELPYRNLPCVNVKVEDFFTMCFTVDACGNKCIESLVFPENACVEGELWNVSVPCFSSPMGQVTIEVYQHSLNLLNEKMAQEDRKILLYVQQAHFPEDIEKDMSNVKIQIWSEDTYGLEIVYKFRLLYCQRLFMSLASATCSWNELNHLVQCMPLWKFIRIMQSAWNLVPFDTVEQVFKAHALHVKTTDFSEDIKHNLQEISELINLLKGVGRYSNEGGCDYSVQIAEEILVMELKGKETIESDRKNSLNDIPQNETILPLPEEEAIPSMIRLEMFIHNFSNSTNCQKALDLLDELERTVEGLIVEKKFAHV